MTFFVVGVLGGPGFGCGGADNKENPVLHPRLAPYFQPGPPDLRPQVAAIDAEIAGSGLKLSQELWGKLGPMYPEKSLLIRGYVGKDAAHHQKTAVRVATPYAVVMALGPHLAGELSQEATELVPALMFGVEAQWAFASGTDLNGDDLPDVILRSAAGELEIWGISSHSAMRYPIQMEARAVRGLDADGDGKVDLGGDAGDITDKNDESTPYWEDVAVWDLEKRMYWNRADGARAWHRWQYEKFRDQEEKQGKGMADATRLRYALEKAWHRMLGGEDVKAVLKGLDPERLQVPAALRDTFEDRRRHLEHLGGRIKK